MSVPRSEVPRTTIVLPRIMACTSFWSVGLSTAQADPPWVKSFTDMLPTMLDAAGVSTPRGLKPDGRSFLPQVRGEAGDPREWVYCWYKRSGKEKKAKEFAMNKRYKYYIDGRLFDLEDDFAEASPIAEADRTEEQQAVARRLWRAIQTHTRKQNLRIE